MIFRGSRPFIATSGAVSVAALLAACSLLPEPHVNAAQDIQNPETVPHRKVVQLGFGREAVFGACIEPACPTVTRKTLVTTQAVAPVPDSVPSRPVPEKTALQPSAAKPPLQRTVADSSGIVSEFARPALTLHFSLASTELTPSDKAALDNLIPDARKAARIVIASRTDNVGSASANQTVALARANTVRDYLRSRLAVPDEALLIDAQGSCCFIASNDTPEGRKQNRRVEIVLSVREQVAP